MKRQFTRIAVVNRGEPAMRLIRAVSEINAEQDARLRSIALYTDPDRRALFVREADEAWSLGSATFIDDTDGRRKNRYLDYRTLQQALVATRADAVWVGWGFVSEHADFAGLCERLGLVFIGPSAGVMRALGDKIGSKRLAEQAGVPVAPWSDGPIASLAEAEQQARRLGFPLMIKATAGGGGRGIRQVTSYAGLAEAFDSARNEALKSFGDDTVFMEVLMASARHIEVQIVGDHYGVVWALGVRDCSVQRRNQKLIEESPSPVLSAEQHAQISAAAKRLGEIAGYSNAGTVEFLYQPESGSFSFMEVNARLQVEHPVTEMTTGADLVKLQLHVARGGHLHGKPPAAFGHAIEVRVNAEDAERGFAPAPGKIVLLQQPGGAGIRVDTGFVEGDSIAPEFDSMLAKVIASGATREEARARLLRALREMRLAIRGGASNKGFLIGLLDRPELRESRYDIGWLDKLARDRQHLCHDFAEIALLHAAMEACLTEFKLEQLQFYSIAARGRLSLREDIGYEVELRHRGTSYRCVVFRTGPDNFRIAIAGVLMDARLEMVARFEYNLRVAGSHYQVLSLVDGHEHIVEVNGIHHRLSRDDAGIVRAPAPAVLLAFDVVPGQRVCKGERLVLLEAMKTEMPVQAPCDGKVAELLLSVNVQVNAGTPLLLLEAQTETQQAAEGERLDFSSLAFDAGHSVDDTSRCSANLEQMRRLVMGFDVESAEAQRVIREHQQLCVGAVTDNEDILQKENEILSIFADNCALFSHRGESEAGGEQQLRTPEEYFLLYLRSLDTISAGVSSRFIESLKRSLAHYGITNLDRSRELAESLLWISKAHQRITTQVKVVISILERRLEHIDLLSTLTGEDFRYLLDRIVPVARRHYPAVSDLAREVRYRYFYRPFFTEIWRQAHIDAEARLCSLAEIDDVRQRADIIESLVDFPHSLFGLISQRLAGEDPDTKELMTEILTRRYYRLRQLEQLHNCTVSGFCCTQAEYDHGEARIHLLTTVSTLEQLPQAIVSIQQLLQQVAETCDIVIDFYLTACPQLAVEQCLHRLQSILDTADFCRPIRRLLIAVCNPDMGWRVNAAHHFTFRQRHREFVEERLYRGLHPMMGKRLELWRLQNFDIERLPSTESVYLFHGIAKSNPRDERLFAFAEVRDLTPIYNDAGRMVRLPHLEMMVLETLGSIRLFQSHRSERARLQWNRVFLYVWPSIEFGPEDMNAAGQLLAPFIEDLGLEKVVVRGRVRGADGALRDTVIQVLTPGGREIVLNFSQPATAPVKPLSEYARKVVKMRQRRMLYPYEIIRTLTPALDGTPGEYPPGEFIEYDLDDPNSNAGRDENPRLEAVQRPPGKNSAGIITGLIKNYTTKHPEGMSRVLLMGDPSMALGSLAQPECRRVIAALDLAEELSMPVDWFPISAGALIAMDSGTENLDWTAAVLRRLVDFTQRGGEVNIIVDGVNVGAQSYWNAEATMLMHTRGILIMTGDGSMLLTGKRALEYSGGVSAEDNQGIGGYERIMGGNGQAQYWAKDIWHACHILLRYYEHTYVAPGERFPRRAVTRDPSSRDICSAPHGFADGYGFDKIGDIFCDASNPGRNRPFDIRKVMSAVADQDITPLERWQDLREGETGVVWDAHIGGYPVAMLGIESHPIGRLGFVPTDGPDKWSAGTLFPLSSKKIARAINAASNNRPLVVIANLSGFDGSPESLRRLQLEYGAEIGRAVVNFRGPMVFCGICRYHGGAYVVFSRALNDNLEVAALEGSYASVIGGKPAAAVVFAGEVDRRTRADPGLQDLEREIAAADEANRGRLRSLWHEQYDIIYSDKIGEVADQFDRTHSVHRAKQVGSLHQVITPQRMRPWLIAAIERGLRRELERQ